MSFTVMFPGGAPFTNSASFRYVRIEPNSFFIDLRTVNANGTGYTYTPPSAPAPGIIRITANGHYTFFRDTNEKQIVVADGLTDVHITLNGAVINFQPASPTYFASPISIGTGAKVNLTVVGDNSLTASGAFAGIRVPDGAELTINGTGILRANGAEGGAGIGGGTDSRDSLQNTNSGTIIINSGTVIATGGNGAAGIGGGTDTIQTGMGNGGTIIINGGTVTAYDCEWRNHHQWRYNKRYN
jgi:hypothetical protein